MRKVMLFNMLLLFAGAVAPAAAKGNAGEATCDAKYFDDLVGKGMEQARYIQGVNYRVLNVGSPRDAVNAKRMTITVDPGKRTILSVDCG